MSFWKKKGEEPSSESPAMETIREVLSPPGGQKGVSSGSAAGAPSSTSLAIGTSSSDQMDSLIGGAEKYGKIRSALGPGTVIQGKLSFDTPVRIDGKLSGEVYSTKPLVVGESGDIVADIQVSTLIVMGRVSGSIKATERIEILKSGVLSGEISTPSLVIEEGARFTGGCQMSQKSTSALSAANATPHDSSKNKKPQGSGSGQPNASAH